MVGLFHDRRVPSQPDLLRYPSIMLRSYLSPNQLKFQYTVMVSLLLSLIFPNIEPIDQLPNPLRSPMFKTTITPLLIIHLFFNVGTTNYLYDKHQMHHNLIQPTQSSPPITILPPIPSAYTNIEGGRVTLEYKEMQAVDTDRHWILFGVPSETNPDSFSKILKPFLTGELARMKEKNPMKYTGLKFMSLPDFAVSVMYIQNVPFKMTEGLPAYAKQCIHIEIRQTDKELSKELFKFITLSKSDKKYFGQFTRFHYGCPPGSSLTERETLGGMLQNHITAIRSIGKVALPSVLHPHKVISCVRDTPEPTVEISLRRIMIKQKTGRIKVWQCILPNSGGGWDGYYADGFGCSEHKSQAQHWALCITAHLHFHLICRGIQVESVKEFIDSVFTNDAAQEAFGTKLIDGTVFTQSAASAASMRLDIEKCSWVNVNLGISGADTNPMVLSRPVIALRENGDLAAHNFTTDRYPIAPDSNSVAYSTSSTTLGEEIIDIDKELIKDAEIVETNNDDNTIATEGSTDSQIWGRDDASDFNAPIIDNIQDMIQNTQPSAVNQDQLADLLRQIAVLKESNDRLLAASTLINNSSTPVSHPTSDQPIAKGTPKGGMAETISPTGNPPLTSAQGGGDNTTADSNSPLSINLTNANDIFTNNNRTKTQYQ